LYCNGEARKLILSSKINRVRVIRRADGYYAQCCLDLERREKSQYTGTMIGLDLGLEHFYTDQHGNKVSCPKFLRRAERRLKKHQRRLSRRFRKDSKGQSKNYLKQKQRLGKLHLKVQRQRRDWAIKLARCVVASNDVVVYEDLQVQNLVKNHHLAKSFALAVRSTFQDAAWSIFTGWLDDYGKV
jgi:putative transposase